MKAAAIPLKGYPNETADYWTQKDEIDKNQKILLDIQRQCAGIEDEYQQKEEEIQKLVKSTKECKDISGLINVSDDLNKEKAIVTNILVKAQDAKKKVDAMKKQLNDCQIPITIDSREKEITNFKSKLDQTNVDFKQLQKGVNANSDLEVKQMIKDTCQKLSDLGDELVGFNNFQKKKLLAYNKEDFLNSELQSQMIPMIKQHKDKITDAYERLKKLQDLINKMKTQLLS